MRPRKTERREVVLRYIEDYFFENDSLPCERDIASGTGIPNASVHRLLVELRESGKLSYDGRRSARTMTLQHVSHKTILPVLGTVACGPGQEEEEEFVEYIHMPESLIGKGEFFALIAKGESMVDAGVYPGDCVIVRRQVTATDGDLVIALLDGKNNLKELVESEDGYILRSMNKERAGDFPDIIVEAGEELAIQGVAVGVYHDFGHR